MRSRLQWGVTQLDLNYLLHRHQVSLMRGHAATSPEARLAHGGMASGYAARIAALQQALGATFATVLA